MTAWVVAQFVIGLVLLVLGAELLVRGASRLATAVGISPLVVGLTVVAFGTSAPELAVSMNATFAGKGDLALGNLVGSNICNVLLVLGAAAVATPLVVAAQVVRIDMWVMAGVSVLTFLLCMDGTVARPDGLVLVTLGVAYTVWSIVASRRESRAVREMYREEYGEPTPPRKAPITQDIALVVVGLALLVVGADWLVDSAVEMARAFGLSELVIGLTVVAVGTSMPEVATSIVAGLRGHRDIAVGNVVGSSVFNLIGVLGIIAAVVPGGVPVDQKAIQFDMPVMMAAAAICLPIFYTGLRIARSEGVLLLGYFAAYTAYLVLDATDSRTLDAYATIMIRYALPATGLLLLLSFANAIHRRYRAPGPASGRT